MKIVDGRRRVRDADVGGQDDVPGGPTEWIWQWQGKTKIGDRAVTHELRKSK